MTMKEALEIGLRNSEREQWFKREVHLAFENKWNDNLESIKLFIAIEGRLESRKAADDEEIRFGNRVANNNKKNYPNQELTTVNVISR
jgi:hypothetical protein